MIEAENLKQVDRDYRNHLQAYLNFRQPPKEMLVRRSETLLYLISLLNSLIMTKQLEGAGNESNKVDSLPLVNI